jgi:hypothetical protein
LRSIQPDKPEAKATMKLVLVKSKMEVWSEMAFQGTLGSHHNSVL